MNAKLTSRILTAGWMMLLLTVALLTWEHVTADALVSSADLQPDYLMAAQP